MSSDQLNTSRQKKELLQQLQKRRTFAIISHPDAGKTTLTEKLLLYSGMIRTAGMVRGRKGAKAASSDWMAMEQERGISITASAMQFEYLGCTINLLDTPGHQDFSEDTYRTLTAADCAIMVIDASKGVEPQTRKLFQVCKLRGIPVLTFINKMDLPARDPFELISEVEEVLGIQASAINWPIGYAKEFTGVINLETREVQVFTRSKSGGAEQAEVTQLPLPELTVEKLLKANSNLTELSTNRILEQTKYELELSTEAGNKFSKEKFLAGQLTPVFFGSAITNFGVEPFFKAFIDLAPPPSKRQATDIKTAEKIFVSPGEENFSAYVFKIQANMNPKHRDSLAFIRICSGQFERDLVVKHNRSQKNIRLSHSHSMLAGERQTLDIAFPGDVVGVINPGFFEIGDTISQDGSFNYLPLPQFPPEVVASIRCTDVTKRKAFDKGIGQISLEGAVQVLWSYENPNQEPVVAAVGKLQFDVLQFRLEEEYGVKTKLEILPYEFGSWLHGDPHTFKKPMNAFMARNIHQRVIVLFRSSWERQYAQEQNPEHKLLDFADLSSF